MKIVTHNSGFHADDVFAVASLLTLYPDAEVMRSRDPEVITSGDIVVDVGGKYDPSIKRFDHHQRGGAGVRDNGIPYASFGLVWKEYGSKIAGDPKIAAIIDESIVSPIDGIDNGIDISTPIYEGVKEYNITSIIFSFLPQDESENPDDNFKVAVSFAKELLARVIKGAKQEAVDTEELLKLAKRATGPVLVLERFLRGTSELINFPGILYVVYPGNRSWGNDQWYVKAVRKNTDSFESKKLLPSEWGGKSGAEFEAITGVKGAIFCHKGRHLATADTKEGILALAQKAVNA